MAHGITNDDRVVSGNNIAMWHRLGEVVPGGLTKDQALERLDWTVEEADLVSESSKGAGDPIAFPMKKGLYRSDTRKALAVVGQGYTPVQNRESLDFLWQVIDASKEDAIVETAGSIFGGARIWAMVRFPKDIKIGGKDPIKRYLMVANGHDGLLGFHCSNVAERVVCANTLNAALREARLSGEFKLKHTNSITGRLSEARKALGISFAYFDAFRETMERMTERKVSDTKFEKIVTTLMPMPEPKPEDFRREQERERVAKARLAILKVWQTSTTVDRGTAYGAFNALTEYVDHIKDATQSGKKTDTATETKVNKLLFGADAEFKTKGLELILAK